MILYRHHVLRGLALPLALGLLLAGCGDDDPADVAADAVEDVGEAAEDLEETAEDAAEEAQDTLDDAGVDAAAGGTAEVAFRGETLTIPADEMAGCFVTPDGGSQGAISFSGTDDAGNGVEVDWAGDSPDSQVVSITLADGSEYQTSFGIQLDTVIDGSTATVNGKILSMDGAESDFFVSIDCS